MIRFVVYRIAIYLVSFFYIPYNFSHMHFTCIFFFLQELAHWYAKYIGKMCGAIYDLRNAEQCAIVLRNPPISLYFASTE